MEEQVRPPRKEPDRDQPRTARGLDLKESIHLAHDDAPGLPGALAICEMAEKGIVEMEDELDAAVRQDPLSHRRSAIRYATSVPCFSASTSRACRRT